MKDWHGVRRAMVLCVLFGLVLAGCTDDNPADTGNDEPPALPDGDVFGIDDSAFKIDPTATSSPISGRRPLVVVDDNLGVAGAAKAVPQPSASADSASYANYIVGRAAVTAATAATVALSAAPAHAFAGAYFATPAKEDDGSWTWAYSVAYGQATYNLELNGRRISDHTTWSMRLSTSGLAQDLTNFLWYDGETRNGGANGYWQIYDMAVPSTATNLFRVDWSRASADNRSAVWLYNRADAAATGSTLTYQQNEDEASVNFWDAQFSEHSRVRWNIDTTEGGVRAPRYNGGQEACWDSQHLNTNCAQ
jgi:hypothetical protein